MSSSFENPLFNSSKTQKENDVKEIYSDEEIEGSFPSSNDASYFEKAQDFKFIIKVLRIKYLGLKQEHTVVDGKIINNWKKDETVILGINRKGVEANVRFLETRLGRHVILSNWDEARIYVVLKDDMLAWLDMMEQNYEEYSLTTGALLELRPLINDLLETAYRRPMDNKERGEFKPISNELKKIADRLGLGTQQDMQQYPESMVEQAKKDMKY
jgi:hypothetical protein